MGTTGATAADTVRRRSRLFGVLLLALIVTLSLPLPFRLAGIAFGGAAVASAIGTLIAGARARREGGRAPAQLVVAVGLGLAGTTTLLLLAQAATYPLVVELERCYAGANTRTARQACEKSMEERMDRIIERLGTPRRDG